MLLMYASPDLKYFECIDMYILLLKLPAFLDRSSMKRAVSEGNIRCESSIPLSISNVGQTELHNSLLPQRMNQPLDVTRRSKSASESDSSHGWSVVSVWFCF